jgi:hypothetical protein
MHGKKPFRINRVYNERVSSRDQRRYRNNQDHGSISPKSQVAIRERSTQRRQRSISCEVNRSRSTHRNTGGRRSVSYDDDRNRSTHQDPCPILYRDNRGRSTHRDQHLIPHDDDDDDDGDNRERYIYRDPYSIPHDDDRERSIHRDPHSVPYDDDRERSIC